MNKALVIHVISEAVVLLLAVIVLQKQIGGLKQEVIKLHEIAKQQEQQVSKCMHHIQQLYMILEQPHAGNNMSIKEPYPSQQPQRRRTPQTTSQEENFNQPQSMMASMMSSMMQPSMMQPPMMPSQQQAPQMPQMPQKINNMMSDIMNLVPAIMPLMSGNPANVIIAELEKAPPKEAAASVEVMDDDDPDVDEALNPPSADEEKTEEQKEN